MKKIFLMLLCTGWVYFGFSGSHLYPSPVKCNPGIPLQSNNRLVDFFKSYDTTILKYIINSGEEENLNGNPNITYMVNKNRELISLLSGIRSTAYNPELMHPADQIIVFAGLIELAEQMSSGPGTNFVSKECIKSVLTSFGISMVVYSAYLELAASGATWATLRGFLFKALKRYLGWLGVAMAIYEIVQHCL